MIPLFQLIGDIHLILSAKHRLEKGASRNPKMFIFLTENRGQRLALLVLKQEILEMKVIRRIRRIFLNRNSKPDFCLENRKGNLKNFQEIILRDRILSEKCFLLQSIF